MTNRELARRIVAEVFVNGNNERANRVALMFGDWKKGTEKPRGGWCEAALALSILRILNDTRPSAKGTK